MLCLKKNFPCTFSKTGGTTFRMARFHTHWRQGYPIWSRYGSVLLWKTTNRTSLLLLWAGRGVGLFRPRGGWLLGWVLALNGQFQGFFVGSSAWASRRRYPKPTSPFLVGLVPSFKFLVWFEMHHGNARGTILTLKGLMQRGRMEERDVKFSYTVAYVR